MRPLCRLIPNQLYPPMPDDYTHELRRWHARRILAAQIERAIYYTLVCVGAITLGIALGRIIASL